MICIHITSYFHENQLNILEQLKLVISYRETMIKTYYVKKSKKKNSKSNNFISISHFNAKNRKLKILFQETYSVNFKTSHFEICI